MLLPGVNVLITAQSKINSIAPADNHQMSPCCNLAQTGGLEHDGKQIMRQISFVYFLNFSSLRLVMSHCNCWNVQLILRVPTNSSSSLFHFLNWVSANCRSISVSKHLVTHRFHQKHQGFMLQTKSHSRKVQILHPIWCFSWSGQTRKCRAHMQCHAHNNYLPDTETLNFTGVSSVYCGVSVFCSVVGQKWRHWQGLLKNQKLVFFRIDRMQHLGFTSISSISPFECVFCGRSAVVRWPQRSCPAEHCQTRF